MSKTATCGTSGSACRARRIASSARRLWSGASADELLDRPLDLVVDEHRADEATAAVHDPVADGIGRDEVRRRVLRFVSANEVELETRGAGVDHQDVHEGDSHDRTTSCARSTRTGGLRTTSRSGRSTCSTTRSCASRCAPEHVKPRLLGPLGNDARPELPLHPPDRAIRERDLDAIFVCGPGHGGPAVVAQAYLEGTYSELYPHITRDENGLRALFRQFSVPRRDPEPRGAGDARLDPRGRRARLRALARLRRRVRRSGAHGRLRRRRRRGRDGTARDELALEQVLEPGAGRARAADPPPQRVQDREPDRARADPRGRARGADARLRP